jgi:hypothetical protein
LIQANKNCIYLEMSIFLNEHFDKDNGDVNPKDFIPATLSKLTLFEGTNTPQGELTSGGEYELTLGGDEELENMELEPHEVQPDGVEVQTRRSTRPTRPPSRLRDYVTCR